MKSAFDIIIAPVVTEKCNALIQDKKYTFRVAPDANRIEIGKAVEELFNVKVAKVNTVNIKGKLRRQGRTQGYTSDIKKAYVQLSADSKAIEFFESMS